MPGSRVGRGVTAVPRKPHALVLLATFARRWRIPAPSMPVVAGLAVALLPGTPRIEISPEIIGLVKLASHKDGHYTRYRP